MFNAPQLEGVAQEVEARIASESSNEGLFIHVSPSSSQLVGRRKGKADREKS
jgi:hypothetical protein